MLATAVTAVPLAMMGRRAHSPAPGNMCSQLRAVREFCLPHLLFVSQDSLTGVCHFQPFYCSSFSAGTSGLWTWHINVLSAISSEAFQLCSHFFVPTFISLVSLPRQLIHAGCPQLAGRQLCNSEVCSKKNEYQQRWHPVFLLVRVSFLRQW